MSTYLHVILLHFSSGSNKVKYDASAVEIVGQHNGGMHCISGCHDAGRERVNSFFFIFFSLTKSHVIVVVSGNSYLVIRRFGTVHC